MLNLKSILLFAHLCVLCLCNTEADTSNKTVSLTAPPAATPTPTPAPSCGESSLGYEFSSQTGRCYKFQTQAAYWPEARDACVAEGALLAAPDSRAETRELTALFARYPRAAIRGTADYKRVAIGIYADLDAGVWKTVDGATLARMEHADWYMDEPWEMDIFPYVYLNRDGTVNNSNNINKVAFICEKAPTTPAATRR